MKEKWKVIPETNGYYEVSNLGRIRSIDRVVPYKHGGTRFWPSKIIKGFLDKAGRMQVDLKVAGRIERRIVYRVIGEAFLKKPKGCDQINHKDGNVSNNALSNLEWVSQSQNIKHAFATGLHKGFGKTHYRAIKVTDQQRVFDTVQEAADFYNVSKKVVFDMLKGRVTNRLNLSRVQ